MARVRAAGPGPDNGKRHRGEAPALVEMDAVDAVPEALRHPVITQAAARREVLARFLALSGPVTIPEIEARYGWDPRWIEERLTEWQRTGKLVAGKFRQLLRPSARNRRLAVGNF